MSVMWQKGSHWQTRPFSNHKKLIPTAQTCESCVLQFYNNLKFDSGRTIRYEAVVAETPLQLEVDTRASLIILTEEFYHSHLSHVPLTSSIYYSITNVHGTSSYVVGQAESQVEYDHMKASLPLLVVRHAGPALLGSNWLEILPIKWNGVHAVNCVSNVKQLVHL